MLGRFKKYRLHIAICIGVCAVAALSLFSATLSSSYRECSRSRNHYYTMYGQPDSSGKVGTLIVCAGVTAGSNSDFLTALATMAMAAFTLFLWLVTNKSVRLAREEFHASHRPRLVVRDVRWNWDDEGNTFINYTLINCGENLCRIEESLLRYRSDLEASDPLDSSNFNEIGPITLKSGEYRFFSCPMVSEGEVLAAKAAELGFLSDHSFRGVIVYSDALGIRRRMTFRRICKRVHGVKVSQRFVAPADNDEYEYTD